MGEVRPQHPVRKRPIGPPIECDSLEVDGEDILCPGESENDTREVRLVKKLRREDVAREYLRQHAHANLTFRLRGPFHEGWKNPWGELGKIITSKEARELLARRGITNPQKLDGFRSSSPIDLTSEAEEADVVEVRTPTRPRARAVRNDDGKNKALPTSNVKNIKQLPSDSEVNSPTPKRLPQTRRNGAKKDSIYHNEPKPGSKLPHSAQRPVVGKVSRLPGAPHVFKSPESTLPGKRSDNSSQQAISRVPLLTEPLPLPQHASNEAEVRVEEGVVSYYQPMTPDLQVERDLLQARVCKMGDELTMLDNSSKKSRMLTFEKSVLTKRISTIDDEIVASREQVIPSTTQPGKRSRAVSITSDATSASPKTKKAKTSPIDCMKITRGSATGGGIPSKHIHGPVVKHEPSMGHRVVVKQEPSMERRAQGLGVQTSHTQQPPIQQQAAKTKVSDRATSASIETASKSGNAKKEISNAKRKRKRQRVRERKALERQRSSPIDALLLVPSKDLPSQTAAVEDGKVLELELAGRRQRKGKKRVSFSDEKENATRIHRELPTALLDGVDDGPINGQYNVSLSKSTKRGAERNIKLQEPRSDRKTKQILVPEVGRPVRNDIINSSQDLTGMRAILHDSMESSLTSPDAEDCAEATTLNITPSGNGTSNDNLFPLPSRHTLIKGPHSASPVHSESPTARYQPIARQRRERVLDSEIAISTDTILVETEGVNPKRWDLLPKPRTDISTSKSKFTRAPSENCWIPANLESRADSQDPKFVMSGALTASTTSNQSPKVARQLSVDSVNTAWHKDHALLCRYDSMPPAPENGTASARVSRTTTTEPTPNVNKSSHNRSSRRRAPVNEVAKTDNIYVPKLNPARNVNGEIVSTTSGPHTRNKAGKATVIVEVAEVMDDGEEISDSSIDRRKIGQNPVKMDRGSAKEHGNGSNYILPASTNLSEFQYTRGGTSVKSTISGIGKSASKATRKSCLQSSSQSMGCDHSQCGIEVHVPLRSSQISQNPATELQANKPGSSKSPNTSSSSSPMSPLEDGNSGSPHEASQRLQNANSVLPEAQEVVTRARLTTSGPSTISLETDKQSCKFPSTEETETQNKLSTPIESAAVRRAFRQSLLELIRKPDDTPQPRLNEKAGSRAPSSPKGPLSASAVVTSPQAGKEVPLSTQAIVDAMSPFTINTDKKPAGLLNTFARSASSFFGFMRGNEQDPDTIVLKGRSSPVEDHTRADPTFDQPGFDMETSDDEDGSKNQPLQLSTVAEPQSLPNHEDAIVNTDDESDFEMTQRMLATKGDVRDEFGRWAKADSLVKPTPSRMKLRSFSSSQSGQPQAAQQSQGDTGLEAAIKDAGSFLGSWELSQEAKKLKRHTMHDQLDSSQKEFQEAAARIGIGSPGGAGVPRT